VLSATNTDGYSLLRYIVFGSTKFQTSCLTKARAAQTINALIAIKVDAKTLYQFAQEEENQEFVDIIAGFTIVESNSQTMLFKGSIVTLSTAAGAVGGMYIGKGNPMLGATVGVMFGGAVSKGVEYLFNDYLVTSATFPNIGDSPVNGNSEVGKTVHESLESIQLYDKLAAIISSPSDKDFESNWNSSIGSSSAEGIKSALFLYQPKHNLLPDYSLLALAFESNHSDLILKILKLYEKLGLFVETKDQVYRLTDKLQRNILHFAVEADDGELVAAILVFRYSYLSYLLNKDSSGNAPLHLALLKGKHKAIKAMLDNNLPPEVLAEPNVDGLTPLGIISTSYKQYQDKIKVICDVKMVEAILSKNDKTIQEHLNTLPFNGRQYNLMLHLYSFLNKESLDVTRKHFAEKYYWYTPTWLRGFVTTPDSDTNTKAKEVLDQNGATSKMRPDYGNSTIVENLIARQALAVEESSRQAAEETLRQAAEETLRQAEDALRVREEAVIARAAEGKGLIAEDIIDGPMTEPAIKRALVELAGKGEWVKELEQGVKKDNILVSLHRDLLKLAAKAPLAATNSPAAAQLALEKPDMLGQHFESVAMVVGLDAGDQVAVKLEVTAIRAQVAAEAAAEIAAAAEQHKNVVLMAIGALPKLNVQAGPQGQDISEISEQTMRTVLGDLAARGRDVKASEQGKFQLEALGKLKKSLVLLAEIPVTDVLDQESLTQAFEDAIAGMVGKKAVKLKADLASDVKAARERATAKLGPDRQKQPEMDEDEEERKHHDSDDEEQEVGDAEERKVEKQVSDPKKADKARIDRDKLLKAAVLLNKLPRLFSNFKWLANKFGVDLVDKAGLKEVVDNNAWWLNTAPRLLSSYIFNSKTLAASVSYQKKRSSITNIC